MRFQTVEMFHKELQDEPGLFEELEMLGLINYNENTQTGVYYISFHPHDKKKLRIRYTPTWPGDTEPIEYTSMNYISISDAAKDLKQAVKMFNSGRKSKADYGLWFFKQINQAGARYKPGTLKYIEEKRLGTGKVCSIDNLRCPVEETLRKQNATYKEIINQVKKAVIEPPPT